MRILLVTPAADFSVSDVARGYFNSCVRAGHDVWHYDLGKRMSYHAACMPEKARADIRNVSQMASETVVVEALKYDVELVVIVSGLVFHPLGLQLLYRAGIPTAILQTESPYQDEDQHEWASANPAALVFTHEKISTQRYGWHYLPHAYDQDIHRPVPPTTDCDVLFIGTGWPNRIDMFERINWTGIRLQLRGLWPLLREDSPLRPFYTEGCVQNHDTPGLYVGAKINLNLHRAHPEAESLNPRAYELAACGAFSLSDYRSDVYNLFEGSVPWFDADSPAQMEHMIRRFLADDSLRAEHAAKARELVRGETFGARLETLLGVVRSATLAVVPA